MKNMTADHECSACGGSGHQGGCLVRVEHALVGAMIEPGSLPPDVFRNGGGWVKVPVPTAANWRGFRAVYVCKGAHKDGRWGWLCSEVR